MEYAFYVPHLGSELEISRFYLTTNGHIVADEATADTRLGHFQNNYVARLICGRVLKGLLESKFFSPRSSS